jgi:hypothetical protein
MARWTARFGTFRCLNCSAETRGCYWQPGDLAAYDEEFDATSTSSVARDNRSRLSSCTCAVPHVEFSGGGYSTSSYATVRSSQRAVVYEFPDGSWANVGDNDPMNVSAQNHARDGAIRREFSSIRELRAFQRAHRKTGSDETEWVQRGDSTSTESTLRHRDTPTRRIIDNLRLRESRMREAFEMINFAGNKGRYEQALRELERRRR